MRTIIGTLVVSVCVNGSAHAREEFGTALAPKVLERISGKSGAAPAVGLSTLNASVENNALNFSPSSSFIGGNVVENVMNGSTGVMAVVQNNGAGSNVLQSVNGSIGELHLTPEAPL